jgi:hypothetical protein
MQPANPMAASPGRLPAFGPPPTPDSLVNKAALAGLVFSTDPKKFRTFTRQFKSAIGAQHKMTLERAIASGDFEPTEPSVIVMHTAIHDNRHARPRVQERGRHP